MIKKNVTFFEYQILKAIYTDVKVLNAKDVLFNFRHQNKPTINYRNVSDNGLMHLFEY